MLKKLRNKMEKKRNANSLFWKISVFGKDLVWKIIYYFKVKRVNNAENIFKKIYQKYLWGGREEFFPGSGSSTENTLPYRKFLQRFIKENNIKSVVDLGCGDFRVGKEINWNSLNYIGVDIVGPLIRRNNKLYSSSNIKFLQKDIIFDELPDGELCLIRAVFQHLCNRAILKIIPKFKKYKYVLITDCLPRKNLERINLDIPMGAGTRPNGLYLELPPFNLKVRTVLEYLRRDKKEALRTVMILKEKNEKRFSRNLSR